MGGVTRYSEGGVTVTLSGALEDFALRAVDQALPGIRKRLEREVVGLAEEAREEWPVRTGVSRDGLLVVTEIGGDYLKILVVNDVAYAKYIRPKKIYGADTAWQRWVRGPMTVLHKRMAIELGPEIVEAIRRAA